MEFVGGFGVGNVVYVDIFYKSGIDFVVFVDFFEKGIDYVFEIGIFEVVFFGFCEGSLSGEGNDNVVGIF